MPRQFESPPPRLALSPRDFSRFRIPASPTRGHPGLLHRAQQRRLQAACRDAKGGTDQAGCFCSKARHRGSRAEEKRPMGMRATIFPTERDRTRPGKNHRAIHFATQLGWLKRIATRTQRKRSGAILDRVRKRCNGGRKIPMSLDMTRSGEFTGIRNLLQSSAREFRPVHTLAEPPALYGHAPDSSEKRAWPRLRRPPRWR